MPVRTAWTPAAAVGELVSAADIKSIPGGWLGYAEVTAAQAVSTGVETDLTGLTVSVTVGANRRIRLSAAGLVTRTVADGASIGRFKEGSTELGRWAQSAPSAITESDQAYGAVVLTPSAGAHTYKLTIQRFSGTGSVTVNAGVGTPAHLLVEDIGPA